MNDKEKEEAFHRTILEIDRGDIEGALCAFDDEVQEALLGMTWDKEIMAKIVVELRRELYPVYIAILPPAIKKVLKEEIEEMTLKRNFISGLMRYIGRDKKK